MIEKESLRFKELEHVLIEKVEQLFRDMLEDHGNRNAGPDFIPVPRGLDHDRFKMNRS